MELELTRTTKQTADALDRAKGFELVDDALVSAAAFTLANVIFSALGLSEPLGAARGESARSL